MIRILLVIRSTLLPTFWDDVIKYRVFNGRYAWRIGLLQPYGWWCKIREWNETKITAFAHILLLYSKENIYMNNNRIQVEMAAIIRDVHCMPVELWLTLELDSEPLIYCIGCVVLLGILAEAWMYDAISSNCHVCRVYGYLTWQLHSLAMTGTQG